MGHLVFFFCVQYANLEETESERQTFLISFPKADFIWALVHYQCFDC